MKPAFAIVLAVSFGAFAAGAAWKASDAKHSAYVQHVADKSTHKQPVKIKADSSRLASYD